MVLLDWAKHGQEFPKIFRPGKGLKLGDEEEHFWKWLFPSRTLTENPVINGELSTVGEYKVEIQWGEKNRLQPPAGMTFAHRINHVGIAVPGKASVLHQPLQPVATQHEATALPAEPRNPSQEAQDYARVVLRAGAEDQVEAMLRMIEPRLRSIRSLQPYGVPLLYAGIDGLPERIPVIQLGHGFSRLLTIMAEIVASQKPVILIDEIENGLHHSALIDIWRGLLTACEQSEVQVFATTHSWECVAAAHQAFAESFEYPLAVFRLEQKNGAVEAIAYDKESLEYSVQHEWEVR